MPINIGSEFQTDPLLSSGPVDLLPDAAPARNHLYTLREKDCDDDDCSLLSFIPSIFMRGGQASVLPTASVVLLLGMAFILDLVPLKIFQEKSGARARL